MAEGLNLVIDANVQGAVTGLQQVEAQMKKATTSGQVFSANVVKTGQAISKIPGSSNQATQSLVNLSRVAQDAPYGFIGIANNINPLLESFQRLKTSSGTTGGAMKALGSSLMGAGGLGLAVGVVSSLLVVFGGALGGIGKGASEASKEATKFKEAISGIIKDVATEQSKVAVLISFINNETTSRKQRTEAIKELQSIAPQYFATLNAEKATVQEVTFAYDKFTQGIQNSITARVLGKQLETIVQQRIELEKLIKGDKEQIVINGKLVTVQNAFYGTKKEISSIQDKINNSKLQELKIAKEISRLEPPKSAFKADKTTVPKPNVKDEDKLRWKDFINWEDSPEIPKEQLYKDISESGERSAAIFKDAFATRLTKDETTDFGLIDAIKNAKIEGVSKQLGQTFSDAFTSAAQEGLTGLGQGIGNILSGENFGSGVIDAISSLLAALGKALFAYGIAKSGIDKILSAGGGLIPGGFAIGLGVAAIAASQLLKNFGGGRAAGGPVGSGTAYVVGEKGPEIFVPNVSGSIIPNNSVSGFSSGSGSSGGRRRDIIRGQNIILAYARTNRSNSRLG